MQALASGGASAQALDRSVLPIAEPKRPTYTEVDARKVQAPPHFEVKAPAGANTGRAYQGPVGYVIE